jgi:GNAT superfamily N-acetyltransferase
MALEIRRATAADIPQNKVIQLTLSPSDKHTYAENVLYPKTLNFVAVLDGRVIGFTSALIDESNRTGRQFWQRARPYIAFVGVLPEHQRQGVGSALLLAVCEAIFRAPWYKEALLECDRDQAPFYEKHGFVEMSPADVAKSWGPDLGKRVPFRKPRPA